MMNAAQLLVKRGLTIYMSADSPPNDQPAGPKPPLLESGLIALLALGGIAYFTLWQYMTTVILTLTVVESPPSVALGLGSSTDDDSIRKPLNAPLLDDAESSVLSARTVRVTSGVRSTLRHLRSKGGMFAPLRGFWPSIGFNFINMLIVGISGGLTGAIVGDSFGMLAGMAIATVATSKWNMGLTQLRIASPESNKIQGNMFKRGKNLAWEVVKPTLASLVTIHVYEQFLSVVGMFMVPRKGDPAHGKPFTAVVGENGEKVPAAPALKTGLCVLLFVLYITYIFVVLPAKAVVVRMQASGMNGEEDTIVPVDKTFGVEMSGERTLGFFETAKTFSKDDIKAILKMAAKLVGLFVVQLFFFAFAVFWFAIALGLKTFLNAPKKDVSMSM